MPTSYPYLQLKKKCIALGAFILLGFGRLQAQEAILTAGGDSFG